MVKFVLTTMSSIINILFMLLCCSITISQAVKTCHECRGINCQRENYMQLENCNNELDICATIFNGQMVQAQGCFTQLPEEMRLKCDGNLPQDAAECHLCNENYCNNLGPNDYKCLQCDSKTDENCRKNATALLAERCAISRGFNSYCYTRNEQNHVVRGCALTSKELKQCDNAIDCRICLANEIRACNSEPGTDGNQSRASHNHMTLAVIILQLLILKFCQ